MYKLIYMGPYKLKYFSPSIFGNFSFSMIIYIYHFERILRSFSTKPSMGREDRTGTSVSLLNIRTSLKKEISRIISLSPKKKKDTISATYEDMLLFLNSLYSLSSRI